jgi:hypothetical protein
MRSVHAISIVLVLLLLSCGCTRDQNAPVVATTPAPVIPVTASPSPTAHPYPDAKPLNAPVAFGTKDMTGTATVTKFLQKQNYNWTSPSWRSPRQQATYAPPFEVQQGFNTEKPADGSRFLFVFFRVQNTGTSAIFAPSPQQIVVAGGGKTYSYRPVSDADVTIDGVTGRQYDYLIGSGGTGGYIKPGGSNMAEGYLIYEVPDTLPPEELFVVANLDYQTQAAWKLG